MSLLAGESSAASGRPASADALARRLRLGRSRQAEARAAIGATIAEAHRTMPTASFRAWLQANFGVRRRG